jgi:N-methylhydantoinase A/oxoprolinase/acetone carboxylase beta subunit
MDADVVLGYIPQVYEGKRLDRTKAAEAIKAKIADTSKISVEEAAIRIKEVADKAIGDAIRQELPLDGLKPKDFDVYVTGSLGSIHGACYGVASGARRIVVFPMGASLAAYGAAVADIVYEFRVPFVGMLCNTQGKAVLKDLDGLEQAVQSLKEAALKDIKAEGKLGEDPIFSPHLLVRYPGGDERIITANTLDTKEDIQKICDGFKKQYPANGNKAIELVAVMVEAVCSTGKVELVKKGKSEKNSKSKASEKRRIYVKTGFTDLEVYSYEDLGSGSKVKGPALLQRDDEIVAFVPERHELTMNQYGVGIIEKSSR